MAARAPQCRRCVEVLARLDNDSSPMPVRCRAGSWNQVRAGPPLGSSPMPEGCRSGSWSRASSPMPVRCRSGSWNQVHAGPPRGSSPMPEGYRSGSRKPPYGSLLACGRNCSLSARGLDFSAQSALKPMLPAPRRTRGTASAGPPSSAVWLAEPAAGSTAHGPAPPAPASSARSAWPVCARASFGAAA